MAEDISNWLNNFFSTIGDNLVKDFLKKSYNEGNIDFQSFYHKGK